jgi:multiple sugar transport system substrate-binding protein
MNTPSRPGRGLLVFGRRTALGLLALNGVAAQVSGALAQIADTDTTLRMLVSAGSAARSFKLIADRFTAETGIKTNVVEMPLDDVRQKTILDLATRAGNIDVIVLNNTWLGEMSRFLVDLSPEMHAGDGFDPAALVPSMAAMFAQDGKQYALPVRIGGRVLAYRADIFEQVGINEPPRTWAEFVDVARKLTNPTKNQYGFVAPLRQSLHMVDTWAIFVTSFGGEFVSADGKEPAFASPPGIAATETFVKLYREDGVMPKEAIEYDDGGAIAAMQNGRAAMIMAFSPWLAQLNDPKTSKFPGRITAAPYIPSGTDRQGVSVVNGWGFGVNAASKSQEEAIRLVKFAASPAMQLAAARETGNAPTVVSVFEDADFLKAQPYATNVLKALDNATTQPNIPGWAPVADELTRTLSLAVTGQETPAAALEDLRRRAESLLQR